ncbi:MAG: MmcQ/YjbR family DNA-binding protein [Agriterribacter sp.]
MVSIDSFRKICMTFPAVTEQPHFEKTSFRVNKKIFATLAEAQKTAVIKLSEKEQSVFCAFDPAVLYPVPNKWGKQGWTIINLKTIKTAMLKDALTISYNEVSSTKK